jgi:hypothetical protein
MPGASVKVGPVRVGSGCCVALVVPALIVIVAFFALVGAASAKQYVLKHPKREHCKAHYIKKTETTKKHGHKIKQTVCIYVAPKSTTPTKTESPKEETKSSLSTTTISTTTTPEPFETTTMLSATFNTSGCTNNGNNENEFCEYTISYSTANSHGEAPPGIGPALESRIPPATIAEPITVPSGSLLRVSWFMNIHNECVIYATINHTNTEAVYGMCEHVNPRIVLTANYAHPASGWLASQSEPVTIR